MADRDDEDDAPAFPAIVRVAGFIWIGFGGLGLVVTLVNVVTAMAAGPGGASGALCGGGCGGLIAAAFLYVGVQTVKGTAPDTLGNGVGSIGISLFYFLGAVAIGFGGLNAPAAGGAGGNQQTAMVVAAVMVGGFGFLLMLAGVLALSGRSRYRAWREAVYPSERRRRGRRYDEEAGEQAGEDFEERLRRKREQRGRPDDEDDR